MPIILIVFHSINKFRFSFRKTAEIRFVFKFFEEQNEQQQKYGNFATLAPVRKHYKSTLQNKKGKKKTAENLNVNRNECYFRQCRNFNIKISSKCTFVNEFSRF